MATSKNAPYKERQREAKASAQRVTVLHQACVIDWNNRTKHVLDGQYILFKSRPGKAAKKARNRIGKVNGYYRKERLNSIGN